MYSAYPYQQNTIPGAYPGVPMRSAQGVYPQVKPFSYPPNPYNQQAFNQPVQPVAPPPSLHYPTAAPSSAIRSQFSAETVSEKFGSTQTNSSANRLTFNPDYIMPEITPITERTLLANDGLCEAITATDKIADDCEKCISCYSC